MCVSLGGKPTSGPRSPRSKQPAGAAAAGRCPGSTTASRSLRPNRPPLLAPDMTARLLPVFYLFLFPSAILQLALAHHHRELTHLFPFSPLLLFFFLPAIRPLLSLRLRTLRFREASFRAFFLPSSSHHRAPPPHTSPALQLLATEGLLSTILPRASFACVATRVAGRTPALLSIAHLLSILESLEGPAAKACLRIHPPPPLGAPIVSCHSFRCYLLLPVGPKCALLDAMDRTGPDRTGLDHSRRDDRTSLEVRLYPGQSTAVDRPTFLAIAGSPTSTDWPSPVGRLLLLRIASCGERPHRGSKCDYVSALLASTATALASRSSRVPKNLDDPICPTSRPTPPLDMGHWIEQVIRQSSVSHDEISRREEDPD